MAKQSNIEWTDASHNFWHGCRKVSEGCKECYMYREKDRYGQDAKVVLRANPSKFNEPVRWIEPRVVFTCSWSDFFIKDADEWRNDAWAVIEATPQHTWLILTKLPENISERLPLDKFGHSYIPANVVLGISAENNKRFLERWNALGKVLNQHKNSRSMVSLEPLLEDVSQAYQAICDGVFYTDETNKTHVLPIPDWVIVGGESGNDVGKYGYRPTELVWIEKVVLLSKQFGISVFVKQLGTYLGKALATQRHGKKYEELPETVRIRQFPSFLRSNCYDIVFEMVFIREKGLQIGLSTIQQIFLRYLRAKSQRFGGYSSIEDLAQKLKEWIVNNKTNRNYQPDTIFFEIKDNKLSITVNHNEAILAIIEQNTNP